MHELLPRWYVGWKKKMFVTSLDFFTFPSTQCDTCSPKSCSQQDDWWILVKNILMEVIFLWLAITNTLFHHSKPSNDAVDVVGFLYLVLKSRSRVQNAIMDSKAQHYQLLFHSDFYLPWLKHSKSYQTLEFGTTLTLHERSLGFGGAMIILEKNLSL